jgi:hypothetical protein
MSTKCHARIPFHASASPLVTCGWRAQGLLLSVLSLSARCAADARLAPVAAACMLHTCEGAVSERVGIPADVISGLLGTIDTCTDPEVLSPCLLCLLVFPSWSCMLFTPWLPELRSTSSPAVAQHQYAVEAHMRNNKLIGPASASCLLPPASCLLPPASCLLPPAS